MSDSRGISRRMFLRSTAGLLALPFLESLAPLSSLVHAAPGGGIPMRMVCIGLNFGMHPDGFFPKKTGRNYSMPKLLEPLEPHRNDFTICSHLDHGIKGGHRAVHAYLSGVKVGNAKNMPEGNVTIDQKAAEFVGGQTRFPSLTLSVGGNSRLSWTRSGVAIPPITQVRQLFSQLFYETSPEAKRAIQRQNNLSNSILDAVQYDAKKLNRRLGTGDREKLDQYFTSVREVEKRLQMSAQWVNRPKPKVSYKLPQPLPSTFVEQVPLFYDLMVLALQTDSTRVISLDIHNWKRDPGFDTVTMGYHTLSHHGKDSERLKQLYIVERFHAQQVARFLSKLKEVREPGGKALLDQTMVLFGSGMGNASSHHNKDLPLLLAGGGFKHGEHKDYPKTRTSRTPACNLFVSMLQRFGLEVDQFGTSSGTLTGLDSA